MLVFLESMSDFNTRGNGNRLHSAVCCHDQSVLVFLHALELLVYKEHYAPIAISVHCMCDRLQENPTCFLYFMFNGNATRIFNERIAACACLLEV